MRSLIKYATILLVGHELSGRVSWRINLSKEKHINILKKQLALDDSPDSIIRYKEYINFIEINKIENIREDFDAAIFFFNLRFANSFEEMRRDIENFKVIYPDKNFIVVASDKKIGNEITKASYSAYMNYFNQNIEAFYYDVNSSISFIYSDIYEHPNSYLINRVLNSYKPKIKISIIGSRVINFDEKFINNNLISFFHQNLYNNISDYDIILITCSFDSALSFEVMREIFEKLRKNHPLNKICLYFEKNNLDREPELTSTIIETYIQYLCRKGEKINVFGLNENTENIENYIENILN